MSLPYDAVRHFHQPEGAYRFSADSVLLARFVDLKGVARAADFGAGCGVVGLCALELHKDSACPADFFFVERQELLLKSLRLNLGLYAPACRSRLQGLAADWRDLRFSDFGGFLDYVMVNPPYSPISARPSNSPCRDEARREVHGTLADLCLSLSRLLRPGGRAALMLPFRRREELRCCLADCAFSLEREELVKSQKKPDEARLILLEARLETAL